MHPWSCSWQLEQQKKPLIVEIKGFLGRLNPKYLAYKAKILIS